MWCKPPGVSFGAFRGMLKEYRGVSLQYQSVVFWTSPSFASFGDWPTSERQFLAVMAQRRIEETVQRSLIDGGCLLCREATLSVAIEGWSLSSRALRE